MNKRQINRHITVYSKDITPVEFCGKTVGYQITTDGVFELPFEIEPTTGVHDFNTCEGCQKVIDNETKVLTERFEGRGKGQAPFPMCCAGHISLSKVKEFNREQFLKVPEMTARKIVYTRQHIINNLDSENWYKEITEYIEWTAESFGQTPSGCGEPLFLSCYFNAIIGFIRDFKSLPYPERKIRLIEYIEAYLNPHEANCETDLNILISTYQKWLNLFPFELGSYFGNLKQYFESQLPILTEKEVTNIYSGKTRGKLHTKSSLIEALTKLTENLLMKINGAVLFEKGIITDADKTQLNIIVERRKFEAKQGYNNDAKEEQRKYTNALKKWFEQEQIFFKDIAPLLRNLPSENSLDNLIKGLERKGLPIQPKRFEVYRSGNKQFAFEVGQSIDQIYNDRVMEIENLVKTVEQKYYVTTANDLPKLVVGLMKIIHFLDKGESFFEGNPEYNEKMNPHFINAKKAVEAVIKRAGTPQQYEPVAGPQKVEIKLSLKSDVVQPLYDILKNYFPPEQQTELQSILETGNNAGRKLLFRDNGNRLTDTFKQLKESELITGCQKKDLISWIVANFQFQQGNEAKAFSAKTIEKNISGTQYPCKNPLIQIENGKIEKFEQPKRNHGRKR